MLIIADLINTVMLQEAFRKRIQNQSYIDPEGLLKSMEEPSPVSIRVNDVKWAHSLLQGEPVPWCRNGYYLPGRPSFTTDPLFHAGCYYSQEASSMFLEQVLLQISGNNENIRVLDLCGAPGGKSTHLSSLIGSRGFLVSNEVIRQRAMVLTENLTKWGLSNFIISQSDPSAFNRLPGFFDIILVDAPCSGEGMFRDPAARTEWSVENAALCSVRQKRILMDVWPALKEDGMLVYSTCTFNPEENEKNIKWLTAKQEAEPVSLDVSGFEAITGIDYEGIKGYGFYPGRIRGEGLFIAVLRKKGNSGKQSIKSKKSNDQNISREEKSISGEWTNFPEERLIKSGDDILATGCDPDDFKTLSGALKIISAGTRIFTVKKKNYMPSHDIAMSVHLKKNQFPSNELGLSDILSYLRRDNFKLKPSPKGWNLITYKGINLGFVNNIGTRFNNYYPVEWRIRMAIQENNKASIISWDD
jgi:16S rRNA C967 or C1407 C5-methylase (RsmB/RsmF family)/NOL1/NOP2/fmu family ribosome biogenesis protein